MVKFTFRFRSGVMPMPPMITSNLPVISAGMMPDHAVAQTPLPRPYLAQLPGHIDFKPDEFSLLVFHSPGHERGHSHPDHFVPLDFFNNTLFCQLIPQFPGRRLKNGINSISPRIQTMTDFS